MILYKTIRKEASAEQIIEKSRFIAYVKPVETKEEATAFITEIRAMHRDATHNVPAMVIGDKFQIQWASDDGEPQGTSGAPMVQMLVKEGLTNLVVVVTRYFGGIKLGSGGLVRAYTSSAKMGVLAAQICQAKEMLSLTVKVDYAYLSKLQNMSAPREELNDTSKEKIDHSKSEGKDQMEFSMGNIIYEDKVTVNLATEPENADNLKSMLGNLTSGAYAVIKEKIELVKV